MRALTAIFLAILITGCAGRLDYIRPVNVSGTENFRIIEKPREEVWNASVPQLGKQFFVINNIDKSSGFINLSYSGDPETYVDCGRITSYVKNARGERTYNFPGARAQQSYEIMVDNGLFLVERRMSLEGRVNLVFEEVSPNTTKVTANTRYIVTRQITSRNMGNNFPQSRTGTISFNTGSGASFAPSAKGQALECLCTGKLEGEILSLIGGK
jgi:hypothetical protein